MKYIILDFDGTIGDTQALIVKTLQQTQQQLGLYTLSPEACAATIGLRLDEAFLALNPTLTPAEAQHCANTYHAIFEENKKYMIVAPFPHVIDTLRRLHADGKVLAIASSRNSDSLEGYIDRLHIREYISCVVSGEDVAHAKPALDMVFKVLERLHGTAEEALVVGDMVYDIDMGRNAGTKTCGVTYGNGTRGQLAHADYVIDDFSELLDIAGQ